MGMEIERKYLINALPEDLGSYGYHEIEQAYLTTRPTIRVRREDDTYYMTYKGASKDDTSLAHTEYNLDLTEEAYNTLKSKADGNIITKRRYLIPYGKYTIELDLFDKPFAPMVVAEVEFESVEESERFTPPEWFTEEVTGQKEYTNSYLSRLKL